MSIQVSNTKVRIDGDSRFVLRDGSEKEGNILVSDAEGNATWKSGRGLVGQDRYIGEPYGGGTVVGIWRENGEEKVLIASHVTPPVYSPGFGGPYNFETASGPWGMTSQYQGTMSYYKFGCFSPGDGSFNTYKAYEAAKEFGFTLFYGIAFYYNYPKVLSDYLNNPGLSHDEDGYGQRLRLSAIAAAQLQSLQKPISAGSVSRRLWSRSEQKHILDVYRARQLGRGYLRDVLRVRLRREA